MKRVERLSGQNASREHRIDGVQHSVNRRLVPFTAVTFLGFLSIGIPLPVLPVLTQDGLGYGTIVVGLVMGAQSLATLLSRQLAGSLCDERGPKYVTLLGLSAAATAGLCYELVDLTTAMPAVSLAVLICGRLLLGLGESFFITALAAWSVARVGIANAGRAMAWSGMAMYGAIASGAPLGVLIDKAVGFSGVAFCVAALPAVGFVAVAFWRDLSIEPHPRVSFWSVLRRIWISGLGMALASWGVGTISAFLPLRYHAQGWSSGGLALGGFGAAYILVRLLFGGLPDRVGGLRTAMISLLLEAMGLLVIWRASSGAMGFLGAALSGLGYSLVFPSFGVEAIRRAPMENRGLVLGAYLACFDLGIAGAGPIAGGVAQVFGLAAVFFAAAVAALLALVLAATVHRHGRRAPIG